MATRIWKPRALPVQQVQKLKVSGTITEDADITVTINKKAIKIQSPADTKSGFCSTIADTLTALRDTVPELQECTFEYEPADDLDDQPRVLMTVTEPGVPVDMTVAAGAPSIDVDTVVDGGPGSNASFSFYLTGDATGGSFYIVWDLGSGDETSASITYDPSGAVNPDAVKAAIVSGMASVTEADIDVSGTGTSDDPIIIECIEGLASASVGTPQVITTGIIGNGSATVVTIRNGGLRTSATGFLALDYGPSGTTDFTFTIASPLFNGTVSHAALSSGVMSAATLQTLLEGRLGSGNVTVYESGSAISHTTGVMQVYGYKLTGLLEGAAGSIAVTGGNTKTGYYTSNPGGSNTYTGEVFLLRIAGNSGENFTFTDGTNTTGTVTISSNPATTAAPVHLSTPFWGAATPGAIQVYSMIAVAGVVTGASVYHQWFVVARFGDSTNRADLSATAGTCDSAAMVKMSDGAGSSGSEIQALFTNGVGGTMTVTVPSVGTTGNISMPTSAATLKANLDAVTTNDINTVTGTGTGADPFIVKFISTTDYSLMTVDTTNMSGGTVTATVEVISSGANGDPEQWSVIIYGTGGTVVYEFRGWQTAAIAYNASNSTLQTALEGLASIGAGNVTVSGAGTSMSPYIITLGSSFAGQAVPQLIAYNENLTGSTNYTVAITTVTAATGPWHWDNPANWENAADLSTGVPVTGDDVRFEIGDDTMGVKYGLDQSAVALNSITQTRQFTGGIGLPRLNEHGYFEYRRQTLRVDMQGAFTIKLGMGQGSGLQLFKIDIGTTKGLFTIYQVGGNLDATMPCVCISGTNVNNTLTIYDGDVGTAIEGSQSATFASVNIRDGSLLLGKGTTIGSGGLEVGATATWTSDSATINGPILKQS